MIRRVVILRDPSPAGALELARRIHAAQAVGLVKCVHDGEELRVEASEAVITAINDLTRPWRARR